MTYDEDELLSRVRLHQPDIVLVRELASGTAESWLRLAAHAEKLAEGQPVWALVIDLTDARDRPKGAYREAINATLANTRAAHLAMVQPGSMLLRSALRFYISGANTRATVHKNLDDAIEASLQRLARATGS
jgi:hypothetical protein